VIEAQVAENFDDSEGIHKEKVMADFRTKIFGLAGAAMIFAGIANAQLACTGGVSTNVPFIRAEGNTELVGDATITCSVTAAGTAFAGGVANGVTFQVFLSPGSAAGFITSKVLSTTTGATEALAVPAGGGTPTQGIVNSAGNAITFSNVVLPAVAAGGSTTVTLTNIRVNAAALGGIAALTPISEQVLTSGPATTGTVTTSSIAAFTVAYVEPGLGAQKLAAQGSGLSSSGSLLNVLVCNNSGLNTTGGYTPALWFTVNFQEGFDTAFKLQGTAATNATLGTPFTLNTETGFVPPTGFPSGGSNIATSATRIKITFSNVPANVNLYVPVSVSTLSTVTTTTGAVSTTVPSVGTLNLTTSETGAFSAVTGLTGQPYSSISALSSSVFNNPAPTGGTTIAQIGGGSTAPSLGQVTVTGTTGVAVYEVVAQNPNVSEAYQIPVFLQFKNNTVGAQTGALTATVSFAPTTGLGTNVPNFSSTSSSTALAGPTFNLCATSLLFPYVLANSGFDTGIAISNTTTDPFGTPTQSGTCTLNFYGNGAPNPATSVNLPTGGGTLNTGTVSTFLLSSVAPGFQGYMIAACNIQDVHGFAYIVYNLTQNNGTSMGYLAINVPRGSGATVEASAP
jgi:hypothetical protein